VVIYLTVVETFKIAKEKDVNILGKNVLEIYVSFLAIMSLGEGD